MTEKTRIWIVGCGGIGGVFAAHLADHPAVDLTVISRNPQIAEAVRVSGLQVGGTEPTRVVQLDVRTEIPEDAVDFVLLATQPPAVEEAVESLHARSLRMVRSWFCRTACARTGSPRLLEQTECSAGS